MSYGYAEDADVAPGQEADLAIPPMSPLFASDFTTPQFLSPSPSSSASTPAIDPSRLTLSDEKGVTAAVAHHVSPTLDGSTPSPASLPSSSSSPAERPSLRVTNVSRPARASASARASIVRILLEVRPHPAKPIRSFKITLGEQDCQTEVVAESGRGTPVETIQLAALIPDSQSKVTAAGHARRHTLIVSALDQHEQVMAFALANGFNFLHKKDTVSPARSVPQQLPLGQPQPPSSIQESNRTSSTSESQTANPLKPQASPWASTSHPPLQVRTVSLADLEGPLSAKRKTLPRSQSHRSSVSLPDSPAEAGSSRSTSLSPTVSLLPSPSIVSMPHEGQTLQHMNEVPAFASPKSAPKLDAVGSSTSPTKTNPNLKHPPLPSAFEYDSQPRLYRTQEMMKLMPGEPEPPAVDLRFQGNLNDMLTDWDRDEFTARRRLVRFEREQDGRVVRAHFRPISQTDYRKDQVVVSCIFRFDKNDCYITSVDAIYLLEALLGDRFSTEEKNRIRRNIETFGPITCSKKKGAEGEAFFNLLMSFPHPKPRNIEKNVKVFPWSRLQNILEKISTRYAVVPPHCPLSRGYDTHRSQNVRPSRPSLSLQTLPPSPFSTPMLPISQTQKQPLIPDQSPFHTSPASASQTSPIQQRQQHQQPAPPPQQPYTDLPSLPPLSNTPQTSSASLMTMSAPVFHYPAPGPNPPFSMRTDPSQTPHRHWRSFSDDNIQLGQRGVPVTADAVMPSSSFSTFMSPGSTSSTYPPSDPATAQVPQAPAMPPPQQYQRSKSLVGLTDSSHDFHMMSASSTHRSPHHTSTAASSYFPSLMMDDIHPRATAAPSLSTGSLY